MNQVQVLNGIRALKPASRADPMLAMYYIKMVDLFDDDWTGNNEKKLDVAETVEYLLDWLDEIVRKTNDNNLKANYYQSLAYVHWFIAEQEDPIFDAFTQVDKSRLSQYRDSLVEKESNLSNKQIYMRRCVKYLTQSAEYARHYEQRSVYESFIYSEIEERLIPTRQFIKEVEDMRKYFEKVEALEERFNKLEERFNKLSNTVTDLSRRLNQYDELMPNLVTLAGRLEEMQGSLKTITSEVSSLSQKTRVPGDGELHAAPSEPPRTSDSPQI
jgi:DNA repair exonuclease SbcCD ATPase subunit